MIAALVMGITVPAVLAAWANVEKVQVENSVQSEMDYLIIRMQQVHRAGPGNSLTVDVDIDSGMFTSVEYVLIGDDLDSPFKSTIRWKLSGEQERVVPMEGDIVACGKDGVAFRLGEGHSSLYLEVKKEERGLVFVEISVQD